MTPNDVLKPDNATLVVRRVLKAPAQLAYTAWTTPEHIQQWMCPEPGMHIASAFMDVRVGGKYRIQMQNEEGEYFTAVGEFQEVKAPERLVYTWDWEKDGGGAEFGEVEGNPSLITIEFIPRADKTEFVLTHTRFAKVESRDNHARGWDRITTSFAAFVEKE